ncbi:hypothetical protein RZS08_23240, partial [Arthrospira platensis SPKY1]|nr:hypothetical protein [Arthrospira platensis SPKY1]
MNDLVRVNSFAANTIVVDDASGFSQLTSVLLTDCVAAQVLTIPLNGVNYGTNTITVNEALGAWTGASSFMTLVPLIDVDYSVDVGTEQILRAGDAIAGGVTNMKIEYGVDTTASPYNHDVTAYQANPADIADVV